MSLLYDSFQFSTRNYMPQALFLRSFSLSRQAASHVTSYSDLGDREQINFLNVALILTKHETSLQTLLQHENGLCPVD